MVWILVPALAPLHHSSSHRDITALGKIHMVQEQTMASIQDPACSFSCSLWYTDMLWAAPRQTFRGCCKLQQPLGDALIYVSSWSMQNLGGLKPLLHTHASSWATPVCFAPWESQYKMSPYESTVTILRLCSLQKTLNVHELLTIDWCVLFEGLF